MVALLLLLSSSSSSLLLLLLLLGFIKLALNCPLENNEIGALLLNYAA